MQMHAPTVIARRLKTFGSPSLDAQVASGWKPVMRGGKPLALLVYLTSLDGRAESRERLADLLWGDEAPERSRGSLRQAVYALRQVLGDEILTSDRETVAVDATRLPSDYQAYVAASRRGDFDAMLAVYTGAFCDGLRLGGAAEFERWMDAERRRLERLLLDHAVRVIPTRIAAGDSEPALVAARTLDVLFPDRSDVVVWLFDALVAVGGRLEAIERLSAHQARLAAQNLVVPPSLAERIARVRRAPVEGPLLPAGPALPLATVGQQLVGRESLLGELLRLGEAARAGATQRVLLAGPAGVGKTRVLDELEARLRLRGARVVRVALQPTMREVRLAAVVSLVRSLSVLPGAAGISEESAAQLTQIVPELRERFPGAAGTAMPRDEADGRRRLTDAVADLMAAVSEGRLVVMMVDNLHYADGESLQVLMSAQPLAGARLLLLWTSRRVADAALASDAVIIDVLPFGADDIRTMLSAVAALPELPWTGALVTALYERSRGAPQLVLAMIRSLGAARLLGVEGGRWTSARPDDLLAMVRETAGTSALVSDLRAVARLSLEVLAAWGRPMAELDFLGIMRNGSPAFTPETLREALHELEGLGLVQSRDLTWALAHDTVADELRQHPSSVGADAPVELLFRYWRHPHRLSIAVLEQLALLAGRQASESLAVRLGRAALASPSVKETGLRGRVLAQRIARMCGQPEWGTRILRGLGFWGRRSERERVAATAVGMLALVFLVWLGERLQPRVVVTTPPMSEQMQDNLAVSLVVQPKVRIENGFGRPWTRPMRLLVRNEYGPIYGDSSRRTINGVAQFERLAVPRPPAQPVPQPVHLLVSGPWYVRSVRVPITGLLTADVADVFRVTAAEVNGVSLGDSLIVRVAPGDSLRVDLTFEYTTVNPTSNYLVGAAALWVPRERASIRIAGLPRPVREGWRHVTFAEKAPSRPGDYYIVILFHLEDTVEHLFSSTSWSHGAPLWYDGNDIHDEPPEFFEALRRDGVATAREVLRRPLKTRLGDIRLGDSLLAGHVSPSASGARHHVGRAILVRVRADAR
jgi:DNA-binding SARP family transcriptional activator